MTTLTDLSNDLTQFIVRVRSGAVAVAGHGEPPFSGIIWREGIVVTSEQALGEEGDITIILDGGEAAKATPIGRDPTTNTAVLRIERPGLLPVEHGDAATLAAGQIALAVGRHRSGHPLCALGAVALAGDAWRSMVGGRIDRLIRLDLRVGRELEGAAVLDASGRIFGMVTAGPRRTVLAIPAETIERAVAQLLEKGRIARGYLGVGVQPARLATAQAPRRKGLVVVNVEPNGPADRAGITVGDVLLAIDGTEVRTSHDLLGLLGPESVGKQMVVTGLRGGAPFQWRIEIGERPAV